MATIEEATALRAKCASLEEEIGLRRDENAALSEKINENLRLMTGLRSQLRANRATLDSLAVQQAILTEQQAAQKAREDTENIKAESAALLDKLKQQAADLDAKHKQADELLAKANEAAK